MPLLKSLNRCLHGLPAGSSAYANLYRWCSTAPPSPTPSPDAASNERSSPPVAPTGRGAALDLGLNFSAMDFEAVAKATHAAIARERGAVPTPLAQQRESELEEPLAKTADGVSAAAPPVPPPAASSTTAGTSEVPPPASSRRGFASGAPYERDQLPRGSGNGSRRAPHTQPGKASQDGGAIRYSLTDHLKDCVAEGQWARAYQLFTNAVTQACRQIIVTGGAASSGAPAGGREARPSAGSEGSAKEAECFAALRKMLAALPRAQKDDRAAHVTRSMNMRNLRGISRWSGVHYYLLWKCLLEAGRLEEVQRVWTVMQQTGFVEYEMNQRTVNTLMALLRHTSSQTSNMLATVVPPTTNLGDVAAHHKEVRRELVKGLEQAAGAHDLKLASGNRRTAESIRITEALQRAEADESGDELPTEAAHSSTPGDAAAEESSIAVGDFNGLLRRARSSEATDRVLRMMEKLGIRKEGVTYASLIAALHNPQYVLPGHTAEELAAHQQGGTAGDASADAGAAAAASSSAPADDSVNVTETKSAYEAYKQERIDAGLAWFAECPAPSRTIDVFNEVLYLLRAKSHWAEFDGVLVQLRGNAVTGATSWPQELPETADAPAAAVLPPHWTTRPNGKTYELLIHRARYVHQWEVMWVLYDEMRSFGVQGTPRVYEVLLLEARRHPPQAIAARGAATQADATSALQLRLFEELRRNGGDVHSFKSTLNVVNAWTKTRSRSNRWQH